MNSEPIVLNNLKYLLRLSKNPSERLGVLTLLSGGVNLWLDESQDLPERQQYINELQVIWEQDCKWSKLESSLGALASIYMVSKRLQGLNG